MYTQFIINKFSYNQTTGQYEVTPVTMTSNYDVQVMIANGSKKDTFNFKINNNRNTQNWTFKPQDQVNIHLSINGAVASDSNMIINGMVKKVTEDLTNKKNAMRVEGVSFSEVCTTALVFYDPGEATLNVMQYLKDCVTVGIARWFSKTGTGADSPFMIKWNNDNPLLTNSKGLSFPVFTQSGNKRRDYYKSLNKVLDECLTNANTEDGSYFWYVNNAKELCIRKRKSSSPTPYLWTEGVDFKTGKLQINTESIYNFIVIKCGLDLDGNPISTVHDDAVSRAKNGFRYYMLVDLNITKDLIKSQPDITNAELATKARILGKKRGEAYAQLHNGGAFSFQVVTMPTVSYALGDRVNITIPSYPDYNKSFGASLKSKLMMVTDIQWTQESTLFTLEEEGDV